MNDRPASFTRMLGRTPLRDQPQHREQHGHGHGGARLDQVAAPRLLDDGRPYGSVRELTKLPIGEAPDNGERREDEPTPEPRATKPNVSCGLTDRA